MSKAFMINLIDFWQILCVFCLYLHTLFVKIIFTRLFFHALKQADKHTYSHKWIFLVINYCCWCCCCCWCLKKCALEFDFKSLWTEYRQKNLSTWSFTRHYLTLRFCKCNHFDIFYLKFLRVQWTSCCWIDDLREKVIIES